MILQSITKWNLLKHLALMILLVGALGGGQLGASTPRTGAASPAQSNLANTTMPQALHAAHSTATSTPAPAADAGYDLTEGGVFYVELATYEWARDTLTDQPVNRSYQIRPDAKLLTKMSGQHSYAYLCLDPDYDRWRKSSWTATGHRLRNTAYNLVPMIAVYTVNGLVGKSIYSGYQKITKGQGLKKSIDEYEDNYQVTGSTVEGVTRQQDWIRIPVSKKTTSNIETVYAEFQIDQNTLDSEIHAKDYFARDHVARYECKMLNVNEIVDKLGVLGEIVIPLYPPYAKIVAAQKSSTGLSYKYNVTELKTKLTEAARELDKQPGDAFPCLVYKGLAKASVKPLGNDAGETVATTF